MQLNNQNYNDNYDNIYIDWLILTVTVIVIVIFNLRAYNLQIISCLFDEIVVALYNREKWKNQN